MNGYTGADGRVIVHTSRGYGALGTDAQSSLRAALEADTLADEADDERRLAYDEADDEAETAAELIDDETLDE